MKKHRRMLVIAGGTGGHIIPAIALSRELSGFECTFMCGSRKIERKVYDAEGIEPCVLPIGSYSIFHMLTSLLPSAAASLRLISEKRIDCVLSAGSYMSAIPAIAAILLGRPLFLLEQDVRLGKANRVLSRFAKAVFTGFKIDKSSRAKGNFIYTGHVVRREVMHPEKTVEGIDVPEGRKVLLVIGGSQGSSGMTEKVLKAASGMEGIFTIAVAGMSSEMFSDGPSVKILPYVKNMGYLYSLADIVVSRAGALSFAELLAAGKKALFIPLPSSKDSHQRANALAFMRGRPQFDMMEENNFDEEIFRSKIISLLSAEKPAPSKNGAAEKIKKEIDIYV